MWISPLYLMKPSFLNLFMNRLTRDRVVPDLRQHFLRYFGKRLLWVTRRAVARE